MVNGRKIPPGCRPLLGRSPADLGSREIGGLNERRLLVLSVDLESVAGVVQDHYPSPGVYFNGAGMRQVAIIVRVVGESQRTLANHVRVGDKLFPAQPRDFMVAAQHGD